MIKAGIGARLLVLTVFGFVDCITYLVGSARQAHKNLELIAAQPDDLPDSDGKGYLSHPIDQKAQPSQIYK